MSEQPKYPLCPLQDLADPGSRGLTLTRLREPLEIFLVHKAGRVYGYLNRCPHTGANLDWLPDQFLDANGSFIQCATHGALFRIEDGVCVRGPCAGDRLRPIELSVEQGMVVYCPPHGAK